MSGTGSSPAVFLNQQGCYPLRASPPPPPTQEPPPPPTQEPPPPSPPEELRGGTPVFPSPLWETPPLNQQLPSSPPALQSPPALSPPGVSPLVLSPPPLSPPPSLWGGVPFGGFSPAVPMPKKARAAPGPFSGYGKGFRPVRRRLQTHASVARHEYPPPRPGGFAPGSSETAFRPVAAVASGRPV